MKKMLLFVALVMAGLHADACSKGMRMNDTTADSYKIEDLTLKPKSTPAQPSSQKSMEKHADNKAPNY